jgi:hypothetical protein
MPTWKIKADVTVDVEIEIEAPSKDEAQKLFANELAMSASLVDLPNENYTVYEDSIQSIDVTSVEAVD